jgi:hypothetical protein
VNVIYFGPRWDAPMLDDAVRAKTPIGQPCLFCAEPIEGGDQGFMTIVVGTDDPEPQPAHAECQALGIVGHDFGVCSCTGYDNNREAARELWRRMGHAQ